MTKEDFQSWFVENIELMTKHGIYHYNTDKAHLVHLMLDVLLPLIEKPKKRKVKNG